MNNLADLIEDFILRKLSREDDSIIVLKRNEIAEQLECAPSQVTYVLSTRFTADRGYIVESRRGLGGFIRIAKLPIQNMIYEDAANRVDEQTSRDQLRQTLLQMQNHGLLTGREAALLMEVNEFLFENIDPQRRVMLLRQLFITLANYS